MSVNGCVAVVGSDGRLTEGSSSASVIWWSFTKTLIAAASLKLAEQGRIALDQPLAGRAYTLRQLLQHRAGVGNYGRLEAYHAAISAGDPPWTDEELFSHVPPDRLDFPPGGGFAYSNVGYLIVRRLLESTCGAGLATVLQDLVFGPLRIEGARVALTASDLAETALPPPPGYDPNWVFHGVVTGPASAAALTLHRLFETPFLAPASREAMLGGGVRPPPATDGYGAGLMMRTLKDGRAGGTLGLAGHSAGGPGSVGAVYTLTSGVGRSTAAAFIAGEDEQAAEILAAQRLLATVGG